MDDTRRNSVRVLHLVDKLAMRGATIHGMAQLLLNWWPAFEDSEYELQVCVLRGFEGGIPTFAEHGIHVTDLDRHKFDPRTVLDLVKLIRSRRIAVLHCHGYGSCTFGRIAATLAGIPAIVHEHMVDESPPVYQRVSDLCLAPFTAHAIAVSEAVAAFMADHRHVPRSSIDVVYNAIRDMTVDAPSEPDRRSLASEFGIDPAFPVVGIVGRLDPVKGHDLFLDAARLVLESVPETQFLIVGDGQLRNELAARADRLGISAKVFFVGYRPDIPAVMSLLDVYACCSTYEGLGLANLEAMSLAKPVVATAVGGIPELIEHGRSGLLVPAGEPEAMAQAIIEILHSEELRTTLGRGALKRYEEDFRLSAVAKQLKDVYDNVLARATPATKMSAPDDGVRGNHDP